jgi:uncharacterized membrane protein YhaH (DUF805 family)
MQGSLAQPPIVLRGSRGRGVRLTMGSAVFLALAAFNFGVGGFSPALVPAAALFLLCGVLGAWMTIAPARLEISPAGIKQTVLWRTTRHGWDEVYNFRTAAIGLTRKAVGFDYLKPRPKGAPLKALNAALFGLQGFLHIGWEIAPDKLADLLNQAREHWIAGAGADSQAAAAVVVLPTSARGVVGGRMNSKTYFIAIGVVLAAGGGLAYFGKLGGVGSALFVPIILIYSARLHDIGRSGWWQLGLYIVQLPTLLLVGTLGGQSFTVIMAAGLMILLVFTLVVGLIPGAPGPNRFGPPPGQPSAIAQSEVFR